MFLRHAKVLIILHSIALPGKADLLRGLGHRRGRRFPSGFEECFELHEGQRKQAALAGSKNHAAWSLK
jgi:hypothetical protein